MAAYGLRERFQKPPKFFRIFDPGTYQYEPPTLKPNKVPFLSSVPRHTLNINPLWTHKIYDSDIPHRIHNITSLKSTKPRFPYEALSKEDLEKILCKCGVPNPCECDGEPMEEELCHSKVKRRMFKGFVPLNDSGDQGISAPGRRDMGFLKSDDGTQIRLMKKLENCPPFYDARVIEATQFYHGWKWSQWSSKRSDKVPENWPGPADYSIQKREPTDEEICAETHRAHKRKTSRQLRFIEMIQQQNIREGRPGPADYYVKMPKGTELQYFGPKSDRYPSSKLITHPGPADHEIRRDFDPLPTPESIPHAVLPEPACFGVKARRFVPRKEEGPSPASYTAIYKHNILHCPTAPFSSSAVRFKPDVIEESDDEEDTSIASETKSCPKIMWQFKSKTLRFKPLVKKLNESSPADLPQSRHKITRNPKFQHIAPFNSSKGRFQPWNNSVPVHGRLNLSHHAFLNADKPRCASAFNQGPLFRAERFSGKISSTPAPNEYEVKGGIETVLRTYNQKLLNNIENKHKFKWTPPPKPQILTLDQKYQNLLNKSIALLDENINMLKSKDVNASKAKSENEMSKEVKPTENKKLLRFFLYSHKMPRPV